MACGRGLAEISSKLCHHFRLVHGCRVSKLNYISSRHIALSLCKGKSPGGNFRGKDETENDLDFFGVNEAEIESGGPESGQKPENYHIEFEDRKLVNELLNKYSSQPKEKRVQVKAFGTVRYDKKPPDTDDNTVSKSQKKDGVQVQIVSKAKARRASKEPPKSNQNLSFVDEQYFSYNQSLKDVPVNENKLQGKFPKEHAWEKSNMDYDLKSENNLSYIDEQYFSINLDSKKANVLHVSDSPVTESEETSDQDMSFIDKQYFNRPTQEDKVPQTDQSEFPSYNDRKMSKRKPVDEALHVIVKPKNLKPGQTEDFKMGKGNISLQREHSKREKSRGLSKSIEMVKTSQAESSKDKSLNQKPQTAYEASMAARAEVEKKRKANLTGIYKPKDLDSKGFRLLGSQVPNFENVPSMDIVQVLRDSIIYNENDIVAISKPYGLPSTGGPRVVHSLESLRDEIIPKTPLFPVHRLDKETTGVMLFAKTQEMADKLTECFYRREVIKKYIVVTKNIPEFNSGVIDIPVTEGTVEGKFRMCLRPYRTSELASVMKKRKDGTEAITKYNVISKGDKCAVLECLPITGKKHQIRVHLAFGLNCPILGDHKYSHIDTLAPMKLHPEILNKLKIQQSKVRYLAMHLHARSITIPEFFNGRNLFIRAKLPAFFAQNLKDLKLKLPPNS